MSKTLFVFEVLSPTEIDSDPSLICSPCTDLDFDLEDNESTKIMESLGTNLHKKN